MKKYKICKILLVILAIFLCVAFYELLGICVAYKKQPEVSNTTKKETKNGSWNECSENTERAVIIEKNPEALLQSSPNLCVHSSSSYVSPSMLPLSSGDLIEWSLVCHSTLSYQKFCNRHSNHYDHPEELHQSVE